MLYDLDSAKKGYEILLNCENSPKSRKSRVTDFFTEAFSDNGFNDPDIMLLNPFLGRAFGFCPRCK